MRSHPDYIYLLGSLLFFWIGFKQFHLAKNVDALERSGRLTAETAARIRRKPMWLIGCCGIFAGLGLLVAAFVQL